MLPDFPTLKKEIAIKLDDFTRARAKDKAGILKEISKKRICEGRENSVSRPGEEKETTPIECFETVKEIKKDFSQITLDDILTMLDEAAENVVKQQSEYLFQQLSKTCDKSGNVVDAKGAGLTLDNIFNALNKIQISFDENGNPNMPTITGGKQAVVDFQKAMQEFDSSPERKKQFEEIIERKRKEWNERETARELVG